MTEAELDAEIALVTAAIQHILKGGQSYSIDSGGSRRTFEAADFEMLKKYRAELYAEKRELDGSSGMTLGAGW